MDAKQLKACAKEAGADLVGIAPVARFDERPREKDPRTIFPECKSVIVIGRRVTRGTLRGVEEGTSFGAYRLYGQIWLDDRFLAMTAFAVATALEDAGLESVPLPPLPPDIPPMGVPVRAGAVAPNVLIDMNDAAVRAGLGEWGRCGMVLTPEFGPRQRFNAVLVDEAFDPTPLFEGAICLQEQCEHVCPSNAMKAVEERTVCGHRYTVAAFDHALCRNCRNGAAPNSHYAGAHADRMAALCTRTCIDNLERAGRLSRTFANPYRKRPAWALEPTSQDPFSVAGR